MFIFYWEISLSLNLIVVIIIVLCYSQYTDLLFLVSWWKSSFDLSSSLLVGFLFGNTFMISILFVVIVIILDWFCISQVVVTSYWLCWYSANPVITNRYVWLSLCSLSLACYWPLA